MRVGTITISQRTQRLLASLVVLILLSLAGVDAADLEPLNSWLEPVQPGLYQVVWVNDGDTITVEAGGHREEVRFIGVDTPELHHPDKPVQCFAEEARVFTDALINQQLVRLQADADDDDRDRYQRLLRYVYLPDGTLVNAELIKHGYGFSYTLFPFAKTEEFQYYERLARTENLGLWSRCEIDEANLTPETNPA